MSGSLDCEVIVLQLRAKRRRSRNLGRWGVAAMVALVLAAALASTARPVDALDVAAPSAVSLLPD
jgi:hypothetical protein